MRRVLILTACIVFSGAAAATANWMDGYVEGRVIDQGTTTKLDIYLIDNLDYPGGAVKGLEGTWDLLNPEPPNPHHVPYDNPPGATYFLGGTNPTGGTSGTWRTHTTNYGDPGIDSYVNFDNYDTGATWSKTGVFPNVTSFQGGWYTNEPELRLLPGNVLASMIITNGSWVHFSGSIDFVIDGLPETFALEFTVPEPGTLAMLIGVAAAGLGLAWRRRG